MAESFTVTALPPRTIAASEATKEQEVIANTAKHVVEFFKHYLDLRGDDERQPQMNELVMIFASISVAFLGGVPPEVQMSLVTLARAAAVQAHKEIEPYEAALDAAKKSA